jgi:hypothetical protein
MRHKNTECRCRAGSVPNVARNVFVRARTRSSNFRFRMWVRHYRKQHGFRPEAQAWTSTRFSTRSVFRSSARVLPLETIVRHASLDCRVVYTKHILDISIRSSLDVTVYSLLQHGLIVYVYGMIGFKPRARHRLECRLFRPCSAIEANVDPRPDKAAYADHTLLTVWQFNK